MQTEAHCIIEKTTQNVPPTDASPFLTRCYRSTLLMILINNHQQLVYGPDFGDDFLANITPLTTPHYRIVSYDATNNNSP